MLGGIVQVMIELSRQLPIVWPIHPRSSKMLEQSGLLDRIARHADFKLTDSLGYLDMLTLTQRAWMILTDSGGLQEEATVLGVPCITLRQNTWTPGDGGGGSQPPSREPA